MQRRHVVRIVVAYVIAAAGLIQLTDVVSPALGLPSYSVRVIIIAALAGLPIAAILAWFFEVKREGPVPAEPVEPAAQPARAGRMAAPPAPTTPLVGREEELATAVAQLQDGSTRLLTVLGPGGIGKTRLAIEISGRVTPAFADGSCFVQLSGVEAVDALPAALAEALALPLSPRESAEDQLVSALADRQLLLVLDNFEQLTESGPLLSRILSRAPELRMLVTSRARIGLGAESILALAGLPAPTPGVADAEKFGAVRLFVQSARRVDPNFDYEGEAAQVARICRLVDGIPLALELAGACVNVLSCTEIADEIERHHDFTLDAPRDLPERHRSLRAAFESSWRLLGGEEQRAFRTISTFRSGFSREAAAALGVDVRLLAALNDKSLVRRAESGRFVVLEVLRQFAEEKLRESPRVETRVRALHGDFFIARLEDLERAIGGIGGPEALQRAAAESNDIRAAWNWAVAAEKAVLVGRALGGFFFLFDARGWAREGRDLLLRGAEMLRRQAERGGAAADEARAVLARLLARQGAFDAHLGNHREARDSLAESIVLLRAAGDRAELGLALGTLCNIARAAGEYDDAREFAGESLQLYREIGDRRGEARALNGLGTVAHIIGDYDEATRRYTESAALYREIGDLAELWLPLNNLGGIAIVRGEYDSARHLLKENLANARQTGNLRGVCFLLHNLGVVEQKAGDDEAAEPYLRESVEMSKQLGFRTQLARSLGTLGTVYMNRDDYDAARDAFRTALAIAVEQEQTPHALEILLGLGRLSARLNDPATAATLLRTVVRHPACGVETREEVEAELRAIPDTQAGSAQELDVLISGLLEPTVSHGAS